MDFNMSLETWVSLATLVAALLTLHGMIRRGARNDMGALRTELTGDIAGLRTELKGDIARLDQRTSRIEDSLAEFRAESKVDIARLDDRVYALAAGLKPLVERAGQATSTS